MAKTTLHTAHPQTLGPDSGATAPSPLAIPTAPHSFVEILSGDSDAMHRLIPLVYGELRGIAHNRRIAERDDHTLNTTAIVHEAFLELVDATQIEVGTRA